MKLILVSLIALSAFALPQACVNQSGVTKAQWPTLTADAAGTSVKCNVSYNSASIYGGSPADDASTSNPIYDLWYPTSVGSSGTCAGCPIAVYLHPGGDIAVNQDKEFNSGQNYGSDWDVAWTKAGGVVYHVNYQLAAGWTLNGALGSGCTTPCTFNVTVQNVPFPLAGFPWQAVIDSETMTITSYNRGAGTATATRASPVAHSNGATVYFPETQSPADCYSLACFLSYLAANAGVTAGVMGNPNNIVLFGESHGTFPALVIAQASHSKGTYLKTSGQNVCANTSQAWTITAVYLLAALLDPGPAYRLMAAGSTNGGRCADCSIVNFASSVADLVIEFGCAASTALAACDNTYQAFSGVLNAHSYDPRIFIDGGGDDNNLARDRDPNLIAAYASVGVVVQSALRTGYPHLSDFQPSCALSPGCVMQGYTGPTALAFLLNQQTSSMSSGGSTAAGGSW